MLAKDAPITLPALFFRRDGHYEGILNLDDLSRGSHVDVRYLVGSAIIDADNKRFVVRSIVGLQQVGSFWKRRVLDAIFGTPDYRFDLELSEPTLQPFEETLGRIVEREVEDGSLGWNEDHPGFQAYVGPLRRCRTVSEIVAICEEDRIAAGDF